MQSQENAKFANCFSFGLIVCLKQKAKPKKTLFFRIMRDGTLKVFAGDISFCTIELEINKMFYRTTLLVGIARKLQIVSQC